MFADVKLKENSEVDLEIAKKILSINQQNIDLNDVSLSDKIISVPDFFEVQEEFHLHLISPLREMFAVLRKQIHLFLYQAI